MVVGMSLLGYPPGSLSLGENNVGRAAGFRPGPLVCSRSGSQQPLPGTERRNVEAVRWDGVLGLWQHRPVCADTLQGRKDCVPADLIVGGQMAGRLSNQRACCS